MTEPWGLPGMSCSWSVNEPAEFTSGKLAQRNEVVEQTRMTPGWGLAALSHGLCDQDAAPRSPSEAVTQLVLSVCSCPSLADIEVSSASVNSHASVSTWVSWSLAVNMVGAGCTGPGISFSCAIVFFLELRPSEAGWTPLLLQFSAPCPMYSVPFMCKSKVCFRLKISD